jgi:hypothetical protein
MVDFARLFFVSTQELALPTLETNANLDHVWELSEESNNVGN